MAAGRKELRRNGSARSPLTAHILSLPKDPPNIGPAHGCIAATMVYPLQPDDGMAMQPLPEL
ncbi:hypothetical protein BIY37_10150 [Candidatus Brocadia sapporoensis]|uniref:Uncharacterized protein n=1 Tax=Candidatus Brocadia sapporoensis TaxID=392547 RepID=A0A1V6LYA1_9BACT|nr:hypothetical protein BIY37_10150 [Candidatus Brocadia sapporoensis]TVL97048.1 MAG: hypothetical protein CV082_05180 [Candidatus Brocadia sp. BL1]